MASISELGQQTEQHGSISLIGEIDTSIEYKIQQIKNAIMLDKNDPDKLNIEFNGVKYDIFFRHSPVNVLYILKGLMLLGYDHINLHAGWVEVILDDKMGIFQSCFGEK